MARWFCARNQNRSVFKRNITHATTLACQSSGTQLDLSPGSNDGRHFSFLQYYHELSDRSYTELLHYVGTMRLDGLFGHSQLSANLFIEHPRRDELHDLVLPRS